MMNRQSPLSPDNECLTFAGRLYGGRALAQALHVLLDDI